MRTRKLMKVWTLFALMLVSGPILPVGAQKRPVLPEDVVLMNRVGVGQISPDGGWIVFPKTSWRPDPAQVDPKENRDKKFESHTHLWLASSDPSDGIEPRRVTFGTSDEGGPQWSPDGRHISFTTSRDYGDGEYASRAQIWLLPIRDGGEAWQLTDAKEGVASYAWSPDGSRIAFVSRVSLPEEEDKARKAGKDVEVFEQEVRYSHIWVIDAKTKEATQVTSGEDFTVQGSPSWSPDGGRLAFQGAYSNLVRDECRDVWIVDVASMATEKITPLNTVRGGPLWSPDGSTIAYTRLPSHSHHHADGLPARGIHLDHLVLYDVATREEKDVFSEDFDRDVRPLHWSNDSEKIFFGTAVGAYSAVYAYDVPGNSYSRVTHHELNLRSLSASSDGSKVVFFSGSSSKPDELYVAGRDFSNPQQLTDVNPQVLDWALGETEVIRWKSQDGWEVEGLLLKPVGYQEGKRYPLLTMVHGGPTAAFGDRFDGVGQFWAGRGWAVLYPNPRGSTGYGEEFMRGNIPDWGGGDYEDIMAGVEHVVARGIADGDKLAVMGWSYGGYMTAWMVSQTSRFRAARMGAGLSNNYSMYGTTDIPGYISTFFEGYPGQTKDNLQLYLDRSGLYHADHVTTPLLIMHGAQDYRVPLGQATEYYRALRDRGKTVELVIYPRAGHGISEYFHRLDQLYREYRWIAKYTLGEEALTDLGDWGKEGP